MKEAVMKVIDSLTQEDFYGAFQELLERYKCIAAGGDYFEVDESFKCALSIKVPIRKKNGNLSYAPCIFILMKTKHLVYVMLFRLVTNNNDVMLPINF